MPALNAWGFIFACFWSLSSPASAALSISPSLIWDGVDGSWSTFAVQIGTVDPQLVRLLPGTSANAGNSIWAVLPEGCTLAAPNLTRCAYQRGNTFFPNRSSTWSTERLSNGGLFSLTTFEESKLGLGGSAYYGFDTIQLGYDGSGMPTIPSQLIAGIADTDYWLGSLGLSPLGFNFTDQNEQIPSLLSTLRTEGLVESTTWAYTAGASYHDPPIFGSLTFGGFDTLRSDRSKALEDIPFGADSSRDLLIGIQSITSDTLGSAPLLSEGIYAFIDSMVTSLWLPLDVCQAFEQAFNLTWNSTQEMYLLSDEAHENLLAQNPTITFALGASSEAGGKSVEVALPYAAFVLTMRPPFVQSATRYFPLQRAQNSSQYTLGRVFFQEAYVIADYDRSMFSVAQALFPSPASAVEVMNITTAASNSTTTDGPGKNAQSLSDGAIAGIVVGVCAVVILAAIAIILYRRRDKRSQETETAAKIASNEDETGSPTYEHKPRTETWSELGSASPRIHQADASGRDRPELPTGQGSYHAQELSGLQKPTGEPVEMYTEEGQRPEPRELRGDRAPVFELDT